MMFEERALTLVEAHKPSHGDGILFHKGELTSLLGAQIVRSVAQAMREAQIEAYEQAIPMLCRFCADGLPVSLDVSGHYIHIVPTLIFVSSDDDVGRPTDMPQGCYAARLRTLRDSLLSP